MPAMVEIPDNILPILPGVKTPAQYIGGEVNSITKRWREERVRFALCFPDTYAIGMSNQGFRILYHLLNEEYDEFLCERAFAPWFDMEKVLREEKIPLFSLENYRPLTDFDAIGFSLQNETSYSNLLNMLDLGGIPLRADQRALADPIVIAGGTGAVTPEPLADFVDAFLIGEGEEVLPAFLHLLGVWRGRLEPSVLERYRLPAGFDRKDVEAARPFCLRFAAIPDPAAIPRLSRAEFMALCARALPGCYVPALYDVSYRQDGRIAACERNLEGVPPRVRKSAVANLNDTYYPTAQIIPFVDIVQNRISIEIMRGCTQGCRYCQAGMIDRPQRYRTPQKVLELARELVKRTGYSEISLLSLSSSDHPQLREMIQLLQAEFEGQHISISLPSLRVDHQLNWLPGLTRNVRKSGLTLAPETGSERLRRVINKAITQEDLVNGAKAAIEAGYRTIKFYVMIGLPTETEEDIVATADLLNEIAALAKRMGRKSMNINVAVGLFVPKAFTPFQWEGMASRETLERHGKLLRKLVRHKSIRLKIHDYGTSWLEALLSRGDRRLGAVVEAAWRKGARFDAWHESCNLDLWREALEEASLDADFYIHRQRDEDEVFPWDMISVGTSRRTLWDERVRSRLEEYTPDCSGHTPGCLACGIDPLTCRTGIDQPEDEMEAGWQRRPAVRYAEVFKARVAQHAEFKVEGTDWGLAPELPVVSPSNRSGGA